MSDVDTKAKRRKRWPEALKREIVLGAHIPAGTCGIAALFESGRPIGCDSLAAWIRSLTTSPH